MARLCVSINVIQSNPSARRTCAAFAQGVQRCGDIAVMRTDQDKDMERFDACILWGFITSCQIVIRNCKARRVPFVFLDMGYWQRDRGYYKVAVNDRHPTAYFMNFKRPPDRFRKLGLAIKDWHKGSDVLVAGMSGKAAWSFNLQNEQWEREAIAELTKHTKRCIVYRPKPSWGEATKLRGAIFDKSTPLDKVLARAHCVVTHHSNVAADALLAGVPVIAQHGIASPMGHQDLGLVETPLFPCNREQWAYNSAYCQWSEHEMASGEAWSQLKLDGLLTCALPSTFPTSSGSSS